jgi:thioredoxin reductase (NADPH)
MEKLDVIIIGSGPAGYTAGIYTARSNLTTLILEGKNPGGQLMTTTTIENFPGFESIDGFELIERMKAQAEKAGCKTTQSNAEKIEKHFDYFIITDSNGKLHKTRSIILAMGAYPNKLEFVNSNKYWNKGISSCAVCDGALPMFRKQTIVVVGGGDSAMEEALFLSRFASKVIILVRSDKLKASKAMIKKVEANDKIKIRYNNEVIEAHGNTSSNSNDKTDDLLESIIILDNKTNEKKKIHCAGLFYAIGHTPNTQIVADMVELKSNKYIKKISGTKTSVEGIFTAGDVSDDIYRQAITAAASGCEAAMDCSKYLEYKI